MWTPKYFASFYQWPLDWVGWVLRWLRSYLEPALRISCCSSTGRGSRCAASYWKGNCHGVVVFVVVCLCTWHCFVVLRHDTTKSSSIAMLLVLTKILVLLGDWDGLGDHVGAVLSVKHKVGTTLQYGVRTGDFKNRDFCVYEDQLPWQQNHQDLVAALMTSVFSQAKVSPALSCHHIGQDLRRTYSYLCSSPCPRLPIWKTSWKPTWDQSTILILTSDAQ